MHDLGLILTLTGGLAAALALGYVTQRLRLSPIVGYLLAGVVVGPNTPGFVADGHLAEQFAEIGVILLMFGVGLQFHLKELLAVRKVAIPGALGQIAVATLLGVLLGWLVGWSTSSGLVFGIAVSVASTVVMMRVLSESADLQTATGHIAVGWLVVEDLFTVVVLVMLPAIFGTDSASWSSIAQGLLVALVKIAVMVLLMLKVGERLIPWILRRIAETRSRELFTLSVLVIALGIAVLSAKIFGVSMALGAFLAGMVVGRSEFSLRAATEALPMRDAFAVLFFVSVGILFQPNSVRESAGLIAATTAIILIGKPLAAFVLVLRLKYPVKVAVSVGIALAQIGEFSFILATAAREYKLLNEQAGNALIAASILSITLNPLLYRLSGPMSRMAQRFIPQQGMLSHQGEPEHSNEVRPEARFRVVIVGYGPVGRSVARLLSENQIDPSIIELNIESYHEIIQKGWRATYGDATTSECLTAAGVASARGLILSSAEMSGTMEIIRLARELNPKIQIFTRTAYLSEIPALRRAGVDRVFSAEGEIARAVTETLLRELGATDEQIDREMSRIERELFKTSVSNPED